ncbi:MAG: 50S ribosomal protein L3 N(5)-glutamine methyltransferase [Chromatiales bacterium]|jgi:ribosomal protein L3 glutamine methyltransferase
MMQTDTENLSSILDFIRWTTSQFNQQGLFFGHGTDNALDEAIALVLYSLSLDHSIPPEYLSARVTPSEKKRILVLVAARIESRQPLAYLTNEAYFAGLKFYVNEHVLVPRSPIAELIGNSFYPWVEPDQVHRVLDLCTGSGCIGIASAYALPHAEVVLSDVSEKALEVANRNISEHHLESRVSAVQSDVFDALDGQTFDLIVSNPPYVASDEYADLPTEYQREPRIGLEAGADGMDIVSRILRESAAHLNTGGIIVVEVGASADLLMQRYPGVPFNWIEFEHGGDGVFTLSKVELLQYAQELSEV